MDAKLILNVNKLYQLSSKFRGEPLLVLPQIVVVGDQSAGKSSLLQCFIGKDFLPAGSDKVTRRPIMLQLIHVDKNKNQKPLEYAVFPEEGPQKYTDFNVVKQKLNGFMTEVSRSEVVRDETVTLQIYSPNVVALTLFDLPGLVATNTKDEPNEAPDMIRSLVERHIRNDNVIILAVVAGNTDVVTSAAVKLAQEVDPNGDRTVLAVTKLDLVNVNDEDSIDKTVNLLMGKTKPYKEGIVGVINQKPEVKSKRSVANTRREEVTFLQNAFQPAASRKGAIGTLKMGSEYLQQLLSQLLVRRITECLFEDMNKRIDQRMQDCNAIMQMYGNGTDDFDKNEALEDAIVEFSRLVCNAITGNVKNLNTIADHIQRSTYKIFFIDFPKALQDLKNAPMFTDDCIQHNIMLALGPQPKLSPPFNAFESMVREFIDMTRKPSDNAALNVKNELEFTVQRCGNAMPGRILRFPNLMSQIVQKTLEFLNKRLEETKEMLKTEIEMEWEYINVNHPDFDKVYDNNILQTKPGAAPAALLAYEDKPRESKRIPELLTTEPKEFKLAMLAYIDIICRNTLAMVPKVIYFSMINKVKENLERHLRSYFHNEHDNRLFNEPDDIIERRGEAEDGIKECMEARGVLDEMRQYSSRREI